MAKPNEFAATLMSEVVITAAKAGWQPKDFSDLAQNEDLMKTLLGVVRGTNEVKPIEYAIDCNAQPFIHEGLTVAEHQKGGTIIFHPSKVQRYISEKQKNGIVKTNRMLEELKGKKVMNANVLDYLLANQELIPEEWKVKGEPIFFWGTIFCLYGQKKDLVVPYLNWNGYSWGYLWLGLFDVYFSKYASALVLAD